MVNHLKHTFNCTTHTHPLSHSQILVYTVIQNYNRISFVELDQKIQEKEKKTKQKRKRKEKLKTNDVEKGQRIRIHITNH